MAGPAREEHFKSMQTLLASGDLSDLTITCGPDTYKVHKAIVCSQSSFFKKVQNIPKVELAAEDPVAVKLLIDYLYEAEYEPKLPEEVEGRVVVEWRKQIHDSEYHLHFPHTCDSFCNDSGLRRQDNEARCKVCYHHTCGRSTCNYDCRNFICEPCTGFQSHQDPTHMLLHAKMSAIADEYDIKGLKMIASDKLRRSGLEFWDHKSFPEAVEHALSATTEENIWLKKALGQIIVKNPSLLRNPAIAEIMQKHRGSAFEVVKLQAGI